MPAIIAATALIRVIFRTNIHFGGIIRPLGRAGINEGFATV
ncbi:hypothetical protein [Porphyrobacter sp. YT40]|nr:hypothetical protein [Porphyrobacter sp. YT40]